MRGETLTFRVGADKRRFRSAEHHPGQEHDPENIVCPSCHNERRGRIVLADVAQFGFEYDQHTVFFHCKCGADYFAKYKIWLEPGECRE